MFQQDYFTAYKRLDKHLFKQINVARTQSFDTINIFTHPLTSDNDSHVQDKNEGTLPQLADLLSEVFMKQSR